MIGEVGKLFSVVGGSVPNKVKERNKGYMNRTVQGGANGGKSARA